MIAVPIISAQVNNLADIAERHINFPFFNWNMSEMEFSMMTSVKKCDLRFKMHRSFEICVQIAEFNEGF